MPNPDPHRISIGNLRWPVAIVTQQQVPDPNSPGILSQLIDQQGIRAEILPIGPLTFYAAAQVDRPITHLIHIRYLAWVDATHFVLRQTTLPNGQLLGEVFRVRRNMDLDGRKRFLRIEAEQESRQLGGAATPSA